MPHGRLTPLGRQLRSVLSNLSSPPYPCSRNGTRHVHCSPASTSSIEAAAAQPVPTEPFESAHDSRRLLPHGWRRLKLRTRADRSAGASSNAIENVVALQPPPDLSYFNVKEKNSQWTISKDDETKPAAASRKLSVQRIFASFIQHNSMSMDDFQTELQTPFELSELESEFLQHHGYSLDDLSTWAQIVMERDIFEAARTLSQRIETSGSESVPVFVYLQLLRRDYISARALKLLVHCVSSLFGQRSQLLQNPGIDNSPIFIAVLRLIVHARKVWPQAAANIVELLLRHLGAQELQHHGLRRAHLLAITNWLNRLMSSISISTAVRPFKDAPYQEAALLPILRYMAEHEPPLQINRQGYRAVIRIQLSQRKTPDEQQWAELKGLSWPPWKVDRTAMDALITHEEHGISRAGATLARMRAAGYTPLKWEKAAEVYAGWDVDKTPTIQTRTILNRPKSILRYTAPWQARIESTRTIQEAWACYLAWEDLKLPHDQHIYLAIFKKLYEEDKRHANAGRKREAGARQSWPIVPGDSNEISPLPPSTHLYTYTRTQPPALDQFYETLHGRGVVFEGLCLSFLVRHAPSLRSGLQRLRNSLSRYPEIQVLLSHDALHDLAKLPLPLFSSTLELYSRFAGANLRTGPPGYRAKSKILSGLQDTDYRLNPNNAMVRAIELIKARPLSYRPLWNFLLQGLTRESNFLGLHQALLRGKPHEITGPLHSRDTPHTPSTVLSKLQASHGAIVGYRLTRRVLSLLRAQHIDLDEVGFHSLCLSTEHAIVAGWNVLQAEAEVEASESQVLNEELTNFGRDAKKLLRSSNHQLRLKGEFRILVGEDEVGPSEPKPLLAEFPRLTTIPSPAVLHAYIRALGWMADYEGLLDTVRWMREHRTELAERRSQDRLGLDMMRKAIVALRVFLERSWLAVTHTAAEGQEERELDKGAPGSLTHNNLIRLRRPAGPSIIQAVREVLEDVEEWEGWPDDDEVEEYAANKRFKQFTV